MLKKILLSLLLLTALLNATAPTQESVAKLYVATFDRAPDAVGLTYWLDDSGLSSEQITMSFFDQEETQEKYPSGTATSLFVETVYVNLFNRAPNDTGLEYWIAELDSGRISRSVFILAVINGALGDDAVILENKMIVGLAFANAGYSSITFAKSIMYEVSESPASVDKALSIIENKKADDSRKDNAFQLNIELSGSLQNPAFSPNGNFILFTNFRNGYNQEPADLYTYNLQTKVLTTLVSNNYGNINLPGSVWNNSIKSIIFSSSIGLHDEIYIIKENGLNGSEIQITNRENTVAYEPSFNPDGQWIVFESHPLDVEESGIITKYKIDGSSSYIQLTSSNSDCRQPNWSPAGDKILYQKFENNQWDIWIMDTDGTNQFKVTSGLGDKTDASFTHDGRYIVFSADFEFEYANIYQISIAGGTPRRLSYYAGYDGAPSVSPDDTKLVFESSDGDPDDSEGSTIWMIDNL